MANSNPNKEGLKKSKGRTKGSQNRTTAAVKDAILRAFEEPDKDGKNGGIDWLKTLKKDDKKTFAMLLAKLLPKDISLEVPGLDMATIIKELKGEDK